MKELLRDNTTIKRKQVKTNGKINELRGGRGPEKKYNRSFKKNVIRSFKLLSTKMWNFVFFARRQITGACLFVLFFFFLFFFSFPQGSTYRPSGPRMSQEGSF